MPQQLAELIGVMRELAAMQEQNAVAKETLMLARKAEQRFEEQRQAQRDDFQRWLQEHGLVKRRTKPAEETARAVLGGRSPSWSTTSRSTTRTSQRGPSSCGRR